MAGRWRDTTPEELRAWLAAVDVPWWVSGGWALDLWLGHETRAHSDIEIGCFRSELPRLLADLIEWEVAIARNKVLAALSTPLPEPPFSLWVRRPNDEQWSFEILAEQRAGDRWLYRRDTRVTLPVAAVTLTTATGWRVVAPEVQLLYKSKAPRDKDEADFTTVVPCLDASRKNWLRDALLVADPGNPWIERLAA